MTVTYREPDRTRGRQLMSQLIDSLRSPSSSPLATTSTDRCWRPAGSDPDHTPDCEEPPNSGVCLHYDKMGRNYAFIKARR